MEPTSEQELKQLLEEGKITEEEYQELKRAMAEKGKSQAVEQERCANKPKSVHKLGIIALIFVLGGIVFPSFVAPVINMLCDLYCPRSFSVVLMNNSYIIPFWGMELAGFVLGIISWKSGLGKAATITAGMLFLLSILFVV